MISFKNKNVLITGATGGIGNELVKKFITLGANVLATGTKSEKLDTIKKNYPIFRIKSLDISELPGIKDFMDMVVLKSEELVVLFNNAEKIREERRSAGWERSEVAVGRGTIKKKIK